MQNKNISIIKFNLIQIIWMDTVKVIKLQKVKTLICNMSLFWLRIMKVNLERIKAAVDVHKYLQIFAISDLLL